MNGIGIFYYYHFALTTASKLRFVGIIPFWAPYCTPCSAREYRMEKRDVRTSTLASNLRPYCAK